jgi:hypothetical protein
MKQNNILIVSECGPRLSSHETIFTVSCEVPRTSLNALDVTFLLLVRNVFKRSLLRFGDEECRENTSQHEQSENLHAKIQN